MAEDESDPLAEWNFDEDFIRTAPAQELSAQDRVHRATADRDAQLEAYRAGRRRSRRNRLRLVAASIAMIVVVVAVYRMSPGPAPITSSVGGTGVFGDTGVFGGQVTALSNRPTPAAATSESPLGPVPEVDEDAGPYEFLMTQDDGSPVSYDPCRPIQIVVNEQAAPPGGVEILATAISAISAASGFQLTIEGTTDELPIDDRPIFEEDRYGDRWAPVLIAWTDPSVVADLAGDVAGIGGSAAVSTPGSATLVNVTGIVALDAPAFVEILDGFGDEGHAVVSAIVMHELGHLLGLNHVDDDSQLMDDTAHDEITTPQAGDRAGLARLGQAPCFPQI